MSRMTAPAPRELSREGRGRFRGPYSIGAVAALASLPINAYLARIAWDFYRLPTQSQPRSSP